jgi:hypothetical protein
VSVSAHNGDNRRYLERGIKGPGGVGHLESERGDVSAGTRRTEPRMGLTEDILDAEGLEDADGEGDLIEGLALIMVEPEGCSFSATAGRRNRNAAACLPSCATTGTLAADR